MADKDIYIRNAIDMWNIIDKEIRTRIIDIVYNLQNRGLTAREIVSIADYVLEDELYWMNYFNNFNKKETKDE